MKLQFSAPLGKVDMVQFRSGLHGILSYSEMEGGLRDTTGDIGMTIW